jgi:hypothetical protein
MKILFKIVIIIFFSVLINKTYSTERSDDLNEQKMKEVTKQILELFKGNNPDKSKELSKYISEDWVEAKKVKLKDYYINYYSPDHYEIIAATSNVCIAIIGGESWQHLLVFKFTEELGAYKLIPMGFSKASKGYIDPWYSVKERICDTK